MTNNESLDEDWFNKARQIYRSDRKWLNNFCTVPEEERERFMENEVENPQFNLCESNRQKTAGYRQSLNEFINEITTKRGVDDSVRSLYYTKIQRQLDFLPLYEASENNDDALFFDVSKQQYGKPKKIYFNYVAKRIKDLLAQKDNEHLADEKKVLSRIFSKIDTSKVELSADILTHIEDDTGEVRAEEVGEIFREVLHDNALAGWNIVVDDNNKRERFAVNAFKKVVYVPGDKMLQRRRVPLTKLKAQALAEHEVGVHALRANNGMNSRLKLLSYGLDSYLRGEEGVASYVQQQREGATEFYGFDRYLALSLAVGLDGETRDFRSIYTVMKSYYLLAGLAKTVRSAENAAWDVSVRCFRGTTGLSAGMVYTKDLAYLEGNVGIWNLLIEKPHVFPDLFVGKYDPLNQHHIDELTKLGVISLF